MTWKELKEKIEEMTEETLNTQVLTTECWSTKDKISDIEFYQLELFIVNGTPFLY